MNATAQTNAPKPNQSTAVFTCAVAALAGLMFGLDIGVIAGANKFIQHDFQITDRTIEWIVSSMMIGATIGAVLAGWISARAGRKLGLIVSAVLFVLGALFSALAWTPVSLMVARAVLGLAIGIATFTAPLYLAEVAPERIRGSMVSLYQLMITIGILAAFLSDWGFSHTGSWRWMLGIIGIPGVFFLAGVTILPKSPRWLMMRGRRNEARTILMKLRGDTGAVEREVGEIEEQLRVPQSGWRMFLQNRNFRRSVGLGVLMQVMQQLTGINVVMYYAPRIFESMGYQHQAQMIFTVIVGLTNVLATFIAIAFVDRWGRKPILYTGFAVMTIALGTIGAVLHVGATTGGLQFFAVIMLLVFVAGFAMSAGPLIWTLCSEVQPLKGRDFGIGCSTVTN